MPNRRQLPDRLLDDWEERQLATQIEAGVLAREALDQGPPAMVPADETELRALISAGEQAQDRFVTANLRLVSMVTAPHAARGQLGYADLFQEGCLGLLEAVRRFDHRRGVRFATYALFWIRAYVGAASAGALGGHNLPTSRAEELRSLRGVEAALAQTLGRNATTGEIAGAVGRSSAWTARLLAHQAPRCIDDVDPGQLPSDGGEAIEAVLHADRPGRELLRCLDPVERRVLEFRLAF